MNKPLIQRAALLCALSSSILFCQVAQAGTEHVVVNTDALNDDGTYYVEFTLVDGSGLANGNSQVAISHFLVNGGALGAVAPPTLGNVTGSLGSGNTLTLADTDGSVNGLADFAQAFTVTNSGSALSFDLTLTNTSVETLTPDTFTLQLLDSDFLAIATTGPTNAEFVNSYFTTTTPAAQGFISTDPGYSPPIAATISTSSVVPEPDSLAISSLGFISVCGLLWRARRNS